jgi:Transposase IS66 family
MIPVPSGVQVWLATGHTDMRKFFDLARLNKAPIAIEAVERIDALFAIEREINDVAPQARARVRNERSRPLVDALEIWLRERRAKLPGSGAFFFINGAPEHGSTAATKMIVLYCTGMKVRGSGAGRGVGQLWSAFYLPTTLRSCGVVCACFSMRARTLRYARKRATVAMRWSLLSTISRMSPFSISLFP